MYYKIILRKFYLFLGHILGDFKNMSLEKPYHGHARHCNTLDVTNSQYGQMFAPADFLHRSLIWAQFSPF